MTDAVRASMKIEFVPTSLLLPNGLPILRLQIEVTLGHKGILRSFSFTFPSLWKKRSESRWMPTAHIFRIAMSYPTACTLFSESGLLPIRPSKGKRSGPFSIRGRFWRLSRQEENTSIARLVRSSNLFQASKPLDLTSIYLQSERNRFEYRAHSLLNGQ